MKIINTGVPLSKWRKLVRADDFHRLTLLPYVSGKVWDNAHIRSHYSGMQVRNRIQLWLHKMDERRRADIIAALPIVTEPASGGVVVQHPELYMRIHVVKGAKGEYRGETSVNVTHRGTVEEISEIARDLIQAADREFRYEVERREHVDAGIRSE